MFGDNTHTTKLVKKYEIANLDRLCTLSVNAQTKRPQRHLLLGSWRFCRLFCLILARATTATRRYICCRIVCLALVSRVLKVFLYILNGGHNAQVATAAQCSWSISQELAAEEREVTVACKSILLYDALDRNRGVVQ